MTPAVQQRLLELNRAFYAQVAADFDRTRAGLPVGWEAVFKYMPQGSADAPITVLDAGCGNGRFARALEAFGVHAIYVGVDGDAALLALAAENTTDLVKTQVKFVQADLAQAGWSAMFAGGVFDVVVCFATLHHLPGYHLRLQVMKELAALLKTDGVLILSNWQFLTGTRFVQKQIDWATIGLTTADVEPGDALLPWQQGGYAVRYVHQVGEAETRQLANDAQLSVVEMFLADGKEGNLNLYTVLGKGETREIRD